MARYYADIHHPVSLVEPGFLLPVFGAVLTPSPVRQTRSSSGQIALPRVHADEAFHVQLRMYRMI